MSYKASEIIIYITDPSPFPDVQHAIQWLSEHENTGELILYHYTNLKGLNGGMLIIK